MASVIIRSKAPLRLGLAGGGTDVSPYADLYGGAILNASVNLFARASIVPTHDHKIVIDALDRAQRIELPSDEILPINGELDLAKGVYNRIVKEFVRRPLSFRLTTSVDAPPGSGLGSSSTLVVAILGAFVEWLKLPLGEYDIAHLAYSIEREDLRFEGGRQDQYAATFGGVNFMEFYAGDKVIVNPLRIKDRYLQELENNLVLFFTETSRLSSDIIRQQTKNVEENNKESIQAMNSLKEQAVMMKEALLKGDLDKIGQILHYGWQNKKNMASGISNPRIDELYEAALSAGATGGKISGAGGGGFMIFYAPGDSSHNLSRILEKMGGKVLRYNFQHNGLMTWTI